MKPENPVLLAVIGAAQGLKGEVRVKSHTHEPDGFAGYGKLYDANGRAFEVLDTRIAKDMVVTRFKGINDRNAAEALTGTELFIDRALLGDQLSADDDYLHADLIGLEAIDETGVSHGRVTAVQNFGAGDILEISKNRGHTIAVPFSKAAVPDIDFSTRTLTLDSVAAGLVDEEDDDPMPDTPHVPSPDRPRGPKKAGGNR